MAIQTVQVMRGSAIIAQGPVGSDGTFQIYAPPRTQLTLRLVGAGASGVVFPRQGGSIDRTFAIRSAGVGFDLGLIRYVGAASSTAFAFNQVGTCDGDGHDANGATCVDDGDNNAGSCNEQEGDNQGGADETTDGADDGSGAGGAGSADETDQGDAVAEHNFPADGCADGNDNGGDMDNGEGSGGPSD